MAYYNDNDDIEYEYESDVVLSGETVGIYIDSEE